MEQGRKGNQQACTEEQMTAAGNQDQSQQGSRGRLWNTCQSFPLKREEARIFLLQLLSVIGYVQYFHFASLVGGRDGPHMENVEIGSKTLLTYTRVNAKEIWWGH